MNFGENLIHKANGLVFGEDTGRLVASFSHPEEAESFCKSANMIGWRMRACEHVWIELLDGIHCLDCGAPKPARESP